LKNHNSDNDFKIIQYLLKFNKLDENLLILC